MICCNFAESGDKNLNGLAYVVDKSVRGLSFVSMHFRGHERFASCVGGRGSHARGGQSSIWGKGERKGEVRRMSATGSWVLATPYI